MRNDIASEVVIGRFYEAAFEPRLWGTAIEAAVAFLDVDAMMLVYGNLSARGLHIVEAIGFDPQAVQSYSSDHLHDDELIQKSTNEPSGVMVSSGYSFRGRPFDGTSVYRRLLKPSGLAHLAGSAAVNTQEVHASLWMAGSDQSDDFSTDQAHAFTGLLPHVTRAMTVYDRLRQAEQQAEMAIGAFDRLAVGVVLLDVNGVPVLINREAQRIAGSNDGFVPLAKGLACDGINDTKKLRDLIRRVGSNGQGTPTVGAGAVRLSRPSGLPDYHVVGLPLPRWCQPGHGSGAVVVLFITAPERVLGPMDSLFGSLYGLTDAEVRLVGQLLEGGGLTAAAKRTGRSRHTLHNQLASIFLKTGTSSQSELLTLLLTSVAPVDLPDESSGSHAAVLKRPPHR